MLGNSYIQLLVCRVVSSNIVNFLFFLSLFSSSVMNGHVLFTGTEKL